MAGEWIEQSSRPANMDPRKSAPKPTETLQTRLMTALDTLDQCEQLLLEIDGKLIAADQDLKNQITAPPPSGIEGLTMEIRNRAMRVRDQLQGLNGFLA